MTTKQANEKKKRRPCLGCEKMIETDRCHRFCRRCRRRNQATDNWSQRDELPVKVPGDLFSGESPEYDFVS